MNSSENCSSRFSYFLCVLRVISELGSVCLTVFRTFSCAYVKQLLVFSLVVSTRAVDCLENTSLKWSACRLMMSRGTLVGY